MRGSAQRPRCTCIQLDVRSARSEPWIVEARAPLVFTALSHGRASC
jgi:hypothetical protein